MVSPCEDQTRACISISLPQTNVLSTDFTRLINRVYWEHHKFYCHDVSCLSLLVTICKNVVVHVIQVSCGCSSCDMSDLILMPDPKFGNSIPSKESERLLI